MADLNAMRDRMLDLANTLRAQPTDSVTAGELATVVLKLDTRLCEGGDLPEDWDVEEEEEDNFTRTDLEEDEDLEDDEDLEE